MASSSQSSLNGYGATRLNHLLDIHGMQAALIIETFLYAFLTAVAECGNTPSGKR